MFKNKILTKAILKMFLIGSVSSIIIPSVINNQFPYRKSSSIFKGCAQGLPMKYDVADKYVTHKRDSYEVEENLKPKSDTAKTVISANAKTVDEILKDPYTTAKYLGPDAGNNIDLGNSEFYSVRRLLGVQDANAPVDIFKNEARALVNSIALDQYSLISHPISDVYIFPKVSAVKGTMRGIFFCPDGTKGSDMALLKAINENYLAQADQDGKVTWTLIEHAPQEGNYPKTIPYPVVELMSLFFTLADRPIDDPNAPYKPLQDFATPLKPSFGTCTAAVAAICGQLQITQVDTAISYNTIAGYNLTAEAWADIEENFAKLYNGVKFFEYLGKVIDESEFAVQGFLDGTNPAAASLTAALTKTEEIKSKYEYEKFKNNILDLDTLQRVIRVAYMFYKKHLAVFEVILEAFEKGPAFKEAERIQKLNDKVNSIMSYKLVDLFNNGEKSIDDASKIDPNQNNTPWTDQINGKLDTINAEGTVINDRKTAMDESINIVDTALKSVENVKIDGLRLQPGDVNQPSPLRLESLARVVDLGTAGASTALYNDSLYKDSIIEYVGDNNDKVNAVMTAIVALYKNVEGATKKAKKASEKMVEQTAVKELRMYFNVFLKLLIKQISCYVECCETNIDLLYNKIKEAYEGTYKASAGMEGIDFSTTKTSDVSLAAYNAQHQYELKRREYIDANKGNEGFNVGAYKTSDPHKDFKVLNQVVQNSVDKDYTNPDAQSVVNKITQYYKKCKTLNVLRQRLANLYNEVFDATAANNGLEEQINQLGDIDNSGKLIKVASELNENVYDPLYEQVDIYKNELETLDTSIATAQGSQEVQDMATDNELVTNALNKTTIVDYLDLLFNDVITETKSLLVEEGDTILTQACTLLENAKTSIGTALADDDVRAMADKSGVNIDTPAGQLLSTDVLEPLITYVSAISSALGQISEKEEDARTDAEKNFITKVQDILTKTQAYYYGVYSNFMDGLSRSILDTGRQITKSATKYLQHAKQHADIDPKLGANITAEYTNFINNGANQDSESTKTLFFNEHQNVMAGKRVDLALYNGEFYRNIKSLEMLISKFARKMGALYEDYGAVKNVANPNEDF